MSAEVIADFLGAMRERGLEPVEEIVADGQLHRCSWAGDKPASRNGAYILHLNGRPAGFVECHRRGIRFNWAAKGTRLSPADRKAFAAKAAEDRKRREREKRERHELAAKTAAAMLANCQDTTPDHPYLDRKGIGPHGLKVDVSGQLVIPLRDQKGKIWSVQTIAQDGAKLFLKGGRKLGLFYLIGELGDRIVIAEGFATGASIAEATGHPVVVALDCGNLKPVAKAMRELSPLARIVIAADDDHATVGNPGLTKAYEAAELIGAAVAVPTFPETGERGTDFNDLAALRGPGPIAEIIQAASAVFDEPPNDDSRQEQAPEDPPEPQAATAPTVYSAKAPTTQPEDDDWEARLPEAVEELNDKHFVATVGGQTVIGTLVRDDALKRDALVFSQERDIKLRYKHRHYLVGFTQKGLEIWKSLGDAWLEHRNRCNYDRIALIPRGEVPPDTFNLWRGFGVEPKPGDWPLIRQHLLEVICSGSDRDYGWLIGWLARAVQHPELHAEVAVVLRGAKGTGKGTLGQIMRNLFRHHALQISNPNHFTGRFNGHLVDVLFLFVDEAFWAGDKTGEGTLKALVTEPTIPIEPKFVNMFQVPNRLKILMASNADWVVPATGDERRYFVLAVSDCRRGDRDYFTRLHQAINGAELSAFLGYLLELDLSEFDFRNAPHTIALNLQKLIGADSLTRFWYDCLVAGSIDSTEDVGWPETIVTQVLSAAYVKHAHDHGERRPHSDAIMVKKLAEMVPGGRLRKHRPRCQGNRRPSCMIPPLDECRAAFLNAMKIEGGLWFDDEVAGGQGSPEQTEPPRTAESRANNGLVRGASVDRGVSDSSYERRTSDRNYVRQPEHTMQDHLQNLRLSSCAEVHPDHPDHPDQPNETAAFSGQGPTTDPRPPRPSTRIGGCAYCRDAVYSDDGVHTGDTVLHHRCFAVWGKA